MEQLLVEAMASAKTEKEKRAANLEYHFFKHAEKHGEVASLFQLADGIDESEAFILAKHYFTWEFGFCGFVDLPEKQNDEWVVQIAAGRDARPQPPVFISTKSGALRCEGHPSVSDALAFLKDPNPPRPPLN